MDIACKTWDIVARSGCILARCRCIDKMLGVLAGARVGCLLKALCELAEWLEYWQYKGLFLARHG